MATEDHALREELAKLLKGGEAHAGLDAALAGFPVDRAAEKPAGLPYSAWQLLEHMRIAVNDLLDFSTNSHYRGLKWPDDYWPKEPAPPTPDAWQTSVNALKADLQALEDLIRHPESNLYATIPWARTRRRSCARSYSPPTTPATTSASSSSYAACSGSGGRDRSALPMCVLRHPE